MELVEETLIAPEGEFIGAKNGQLLGDVEDGEAAFEYRRKDAGRAEVLRVEGDQLFQRFAREVVDLKIQAFGESLPGGELEGVVAVGAGGNVRDEEARVLGEIDEQRLAGNGGSVES